jgi:hypothetical protein
MGIPVGQREFDEAVARRALAAVPLASDPFVLLAAESLVRDPRGQSDREPALLSEALRRNPRLPIARFLMMRNMAANGDLRGAFGQLDIYHRLSPTVVSQAMDAIARQIDSPRRMDQALAAIAGHPNLYGPFVASLVGKNRPRDAVVRMAQGIPAEILANPAIRGSVVGQLVDVQEFALARSIWQHGSNAGAAGLVFSPDFSDRRTGPFNWEMLDTTSGSAVLGKDRGLAVVYYDRSPARLARQIVTLPPGRYRLSVEFRQLSGSAHNVQLQISCYGGSKPLANIVLFAAKPSPTRAAAMFDVPVQNCTGQELSIAGILAERRSETEVEVQRVDIAPIGTN